MPFGPRLISTNKDGMNFLMLKGRSWNGVWAIAGFPGFLLGGLSYMKTEQSTTNHSYTSSSTLHN